MRVHMRRQDGPQVIWCQAQEVQAWASYLGLPGPGCGRLALQDGQQGPLQGQPDAGRPRAQAARVLLAACTDRTRSAQGPRWVTARHRQWASPRLCASALAARVHPREGGSGLQAAWVRVLLHAPEPAGRARRRPGRSGQACLAVAVRVRCRQGSAAERGGRCLGGTPALLAWALLSCRPAGSHLLLARQPC